MFSGWLALTTIAANRRNIVGAASRAISSMGGWGRAAGEPKRAAGRFAPPQPPSINAATIGVRDAHDYLPHGRKARRSRSRLRRKQRVFIARWADRITQHAAALAALCRAVEPVLFIA